MFVRVLRPVMIRAALVAMAAAFVLSPGASSPAAAASAAGRPNILLIVADDLGYSDLGAFGSEIATPNIDALARQGRIYTSMYATPLCAITRANLVSGTDHHLVGLGTMLTPDEHQKDAPGYEGYLTDRALSFVEVLRDGGYHTYMAGKWHLGHADDQSPGARGFESSYVLLPGYGDHYVASPGRYVGAEAGLYLYRENDHLVEPPPGFYSTDFYTDRLIADIDRNRDDGRPFFAFAAYTSPHWPLQAPQSFIDAQKGRYDEGYDVIRARRLVRQRELGIITRREQAAQPVPDAGQWAQWKPRTLPYVDLREWKDLSAAHGGLRGHGGEPRLERRAPGAAPEGYRPVRQHADRVHVRQRRGTGCADTA